MIAAFPCASTLKSAVLRRWRVVFSMLVATSALHGQMNPGETVADAAVPQNKAMHSVTDVPGLPRVLLIGDSISIAYTLPVRELLAGKANVHRIPVNGTHSKTGRSALAKWLGEGNWDVVVFNFGLHDAKLVPITGQPAVSREAYVENITAIAQHLKATGAQVLFATTTPIPQTLMAPTLMPGPLPAKARLFDSIPERNALAMDALKDAGVTIVDLYSVILPHQEKLQRRDDVHFTPEGSQVLARTVADSILAQP